MIEEDDKILNAMGCQSANSFCQTVGCTPYVKFKFIIEEMKPRITNYTKMKEDRREQLLTTTADIPTRLQKGDKKDNKQVGEREKEKLGESLSIANQEQSEENNTQKNKGNQLQRQEILEGAKKMEGSEFEKNKKDEKLKKAKDILRKQIKNLQKKIDC